MSKITKTQTEIQAETLVSKRKELAALNDEIHQKEQYIKSLRQELKEFDSKFFQGISIRFIKLDRINEQIIDLKEERDGFRPSDDEISQASKEIEDIFESENDCFDEAEPESTSKLSTKNIKTLYKKVSRLIHPDYAYDSEDRQYRQELMTKVNLAYKANDQATLEKILSSLDSKTSQNETTEDYGISTELEAILQEIRKAKLKLIHLDDEISDLHNLEVYQLFLQVKDAQENGVDLVSELIEDLDHKIYQANKELEVLKKKSSVARNYV